MSRGHEAGQVLEVPTTTEVAAILGEPVRALGGWVINRVREDGVIDAHIPLGQLDVSGVPLDLENVKRLVGLFDERAAEVGGTGQRDAVVVGHVQRDGFYMLDGFHRHETQTRRGVPLLHSTVEPKITYDQVVQRRLEYAHDHPEIEFAREVEWVQGAWERTPWHELMPDAITAFRALKKDYADEGTEDVALLDSLSEEEFQQVREWVTTQSAAWGYTPRQIREKLAHVEFFAKDLVPLIYRGAGLPPTGRIALTTVDAITETYAGEYQIQGAVVSLVLKHGLNAPQTRVLISKLEDQNVLSAAAVRRVAKSIDFDRIKASSRASRETTSRPGFGVYSRGISGAREAHEDETVGETLSYVRGLLPNIQADAESGNWGRKEINDALEISVVLAETVAKVSKTKSRARAVK